MIHSRIMEKYYSKVPRVLCLTSIMVHIHLLHPAIRLPAMLPSAAASARILLKISSVYAKPIHPESATAPSLLSCLTQTEIISVKSAVNTERLPGARGVWDGLTAWLYAIPDASAGLLICP